MRILHVNKFLYRRGGAESYMLDLAELQVARGDEVAFFAMQHPDNERATFERWFPPHLATDPAPSTLPGQVQGLGRMIWSASSRRGMEQVLRRFRPDVAHLHNVYHQLSPSILRPLRQAGVPVVMTLHDYKLACPSYQMLHDGRPCDACITGGRRQAVVRRCKGSLAASAAVAIESSAHRAVGAWGAVDRFVCPSRFLGDVMRRAGVYPDRLREVPHFVAPATPSGEVVGAPSAPGRAEADFLFAGRLSPEKGIDTLVDAVCRVGPAGRTSPRLVIAGDGPQRAALEARVAAAGNGGPSPVRFVGRLDAGGVAEAMQRAVAVVVPSRWYENQPMTILEAFAAGRPVIGTDLGGIPELVRPGETGLLVAPDDPAALAAALQDLADDPALARRLGQRARERAVTRHSPDAHLDALDRVYAEAAACRGADGPPGGRVSRRRGSSPA